MEVQANSMFEGQKKAYWRMRDELWQQSANGE